MRNLEMLAALLVAFLGVQSLGKNVGKGTASVETKANWKSKVTALEDSVRNMEADIQAIREMMTSLTAKHGSCLADITSSDCPPPPSGKTSVAGGISANTAALADKCDASTCSDIQETIAELPPKLLGCPLGGRIFGDSCYRLFPQRITTYSFAEKKCQEFGGELVSLETKDENDFVENMLNEARDDGILSVGTQPGESTDIWLSARRPNTGSPFIWKTGSSLSFSDWHSGQPTVNSHGGEALCMQALRNSRGFWAWSVSSCDGGDYDNAVVCEKKLAREYLVVTSGRSKNHPDHEYPLEVEIITEHGVCKHSIPNFPVGLVYSESAYMESKYLMTCGMELDTPSLEEWKAPCYKLDKSGTNWVQAAPMIKARHTMTMTKVGEVLFAFGNHNMHKKEHIEKYSNNKWEELSSPLIRTRQGQCTVLYKNTLITIGDINHTPDVEQLDLTTMTVSFNTLPRFPINNLHDHACIVVQEDGVDVIFVTGGRLGHPDNGQRKVWKYNGGDEWELDGEMNVSRYHHTVGVLGGKLVVVGGSTQFWATPTGSIEIREKNGKWREFVTGLSTPRLMHAMSLIPSTDSGIFSCKS